MTTIAGFCGDKDVLAHLRIMSALATRGWAVPIRNARSLDPGEVAERMVRLEHGKIISDAKNEAFQAGNESEEQVLTDKKDSV